MEIYSDIWLVMRNSYRKMGLSKEEINDRMLCKVNKVLEGKNDLGKCDEINKSKKRK